MARLVTNGLLADAVKFLAHALPKRESVWWAWVCAPARRRAPHRLRRIANALAATETLGDAAQRRQSARGDVPPPRRLISERRAGCAALAAFLSMGSVAPPNAQAVAPPEFASAKAVAGAVTLSAVAEPKQAEARFKEYIGLGLEVADRTQLWQT